MTAGDDAERSDEEERRIEHGVKRLPAVDFTLGYEVRSVSADLESKPVVIAESQLAAFHIDEQRLVRLSPQHREYLQRWLR